jgi:hypothetical protein
VVAYIDVRAHKVYAISGNVYHAVTARKLNLRRDLKFSAMQKGRCGRPGDWTLPQPLAHTSRVASAPGECSLNDKKWFVLLQLR